MALPRRIIPIENPDKIWHESWHTNRSMLNFPHPTRICLMGPPNTGKTTVIKNLILRSQEPFEDIFVIHCDPEFTKEYDDLDCTFLDEIPSADQWQGEVKSLCILEDLPFKEMNKDQKRNLSRLFSFVSTHKNMSVYLSAQDGFDIPPIVRRTANVWIIWRSPDIDSMSTIARRTGLSSKHFKRIFDKLMTEDKDSLWIDMTNKSPYRLRKNGFELIRSLRPRTAS